jgi:hypothetical protein
MSGTWTLVIIAIYCAGSVLLYSILSRYAEREVHDWFHPEERAARRQLQAQPKPVVELGPGYRGAPAHAKSIRPRLLRLTWIPGVVIGAKIERQDRTTLCILLLVFELRVVLTQNMVRENEK